MKKIKQDPLYIITVAIIILTIIVAGLGGFYVNNGVPWDFINQYGDAVRIYGNGIYANDSYFRAPINKGTDFTMLFLSTPLLIAALTIDIIKKNLNSRMFLVSIISVFTYYSTSIAFGVTYNILHLLYIALFSLSFFGLIIGLSGLSKEKIMVKHGYEMPTKGVYIFLFLLGVCLFVAWLPDIINSIVKGRSLASIDVYTTEITYVLDMGIISPVAFICMYLLKKENTIGFLLLDILLTVCMIIGIMLPIQTAFQTSAGIEIPLPALITKVGLFCILSIFAIMFKIKLIKSLGVKI